MRGVFIFCLVPNALLPLITLPTVVSKIKTNVSIYFIYLFTLDILYSSMDLFSASKGDCY